MNQRDNHRLIFDGLKSPQAAYLGQRAQEGSLHSRRASAVMFCPGVVGPLLAT